MEEKSFSKIKKQNPVSVIVHATNSVGRNLAKILLEQGSKVVLIDSFDSKSKKLILELKKLGEVDFVDIDGIEDLMKNIARIDYLFYIQSEFLLSNDSFTSKDFLEESNNLNLCLKVGQKYQAKFTLLTSIFLNKKLVYANQSTPSTYSPEELQKYSETLTAEYHDKSKMNVRILRAGTILGKEDNVEHFKTLNQLFEDSVKNDAINIVGEGLDIHYLIHISDLIYGILKLTFSSITDGEVISLCNDNEYTTLSIAYKLLELNPNATEIKFVRNPEAKRFSHVQYIPAPNAQEYAWKQKRSLEKAVYETLEAKYSKYKKKWSVQPFTESEYQKKLEEIRQRKTTPKLVNKKGKANVIVTPTGEAVSKALEPFKAFTLKGKFTKKNLLKNFVLLLTLSIVFYFLAYPLISLSAGSFSIYTSFGKISKFDVFEVENELFSVNKNLENMQKSFNRLHWVFAAVGKQEIHEETAILLHGLKTGSEGLIGMSEGVQPLVKYMEEFEPALGFQDGAPTTTREYTTILKELEKNSEQISDSTHKITLALRSVQNINKKVYPNFLHTRLDEIQKFALSFEQDFEPITKVINFLPETLGVNERKRYLILLQNPGEIRSTGGWISSYAILGIEGGQIRELVVDDVYNLDGELKNKQKFFEAPQEMQDALEIKEFALALSNWSPHFPESAKEAQFFVKEANKAPRIDGVVAIDIFLLQDLLDLWEGIYISGESDLITSENIYEKVFFLHTNFTPGQSQKATFLTNLADEIIQKVFSSDFNENSKIFNAFLNSLDTKNTLLHFNNVNAQQYFSQKGWTGEISPTQYSLSPIPIEWNWGANKANLFLEREQKIKVDIKNSDEIEFEYSLMLQNNSTSTTYPQGEYKNFLRLYLPQSAEISSIAGFLNDEHNLSNQYGMKVISGWFNVPPASTKELNVKYVVSDTKNLFEKKSNELNLKSNIFKQPGTSRDDTIRVEITYPHNWTLKEDGGFDEARNYLILQEKLGKEKHVNIKWSL